MDDKKPLKVKRLSVKSSTIHGFGVFAAEEISEGEVIEECYTLLTKKSEIFTSYFFSMENYLALPLGNGVIYNHSTNPNAIYECDLKRCLTVFKSLRAIAIGEEILIDYGKDWFECRKMKDKTLPQTRRFISTTQKNLAKMILKFGAVLAFVVLVILFQFR